MEQKISVVSEQLKALQAQLIAALEALEPQARFRLDPWTRQEGGGGISAVLEGGEHLEKAGINFSHVAGSGLPPTATAHRPHLAGSDFQALGVSVVIHPKNPYAPTSHMNTRLFVANVQGKEPIWWFGGGFDLTPYYGFVEDCVLWHQAAKAACEPFTFASYEKFKKDCDDYFYLKHRQEPRGIGGIFYDDLNASEFEPVFAFHSEVSLQYQKAYLEILKRRIGLPFGVAECEHQRLRRGRYVEFNLLYDRGTLFGLQSNGRTESILMSLPPEVSWHYDAQPKTAKEAELLDFYLKPRDWLAYR